MPDLGDVLPFSADLYSAPPDQGGELVNALSVVLTITLPDGTTLTPTLGDPVATGQYRYNYPSTMAGRHTGRWLFTFFGGSTTAYTETFDVRPADPGDIISLTDAKAALNKSATDTADDEEIRSMIEAITRVVENHLQETVARRSVTEYGTVRGGVLVLGATPVLSLTSVASLDGVVTWDPANLLVADPDAGLVTAASGRSLSGNVQVTYTAGYAVVPANYAEAAKIILRHLWQIQQAPGIGPPSPFGDETTITPSGMGFAIPNRAVELLGGRPPVMV